MYRQWKKVQSLAGILAVWALCVGSLPAALGNVGVAQAGTTTGAAVTLSGVDNLANTVDTYAKGNMGKVLGIFMGLGGLGLSLSGRPGTGLGVGLTGVGMAFVPNIIGTSFDATGAAPLLAGAMPASGPAPWWEPGLGLLYPAMLGLKWLQDPVVLVMLLLAVLLPRLGDYRPAPGHTG